jgi:predicted DNA-binding protein
MKMKPLDVRFPVETMTRIKAIAEDNGLTASVVARDAIELGLDLLSWGGVSDEALTAMFADGDSKDQLDLLK